MTITNNSSFIGDQAPRQFDHNLAIFFLGMGILLIGSGLRVNRDELIVAGNALVLGGFWVTAWILLYPKYVARQKETNKSTGSLAKNRFYVYVGALVFSVLYAFAEWLV